MKSWGCPWFPFVLELLRESAAKSTSPLTYEGGIQSLSPLANSDFSGWVYLTSSEAKIEFKPIEPRNPWVDAFSSSSLAGRFS